MNKETQPLITRFKRALPWATVGWTQDMSFKETIIKGGLDGASVIGLVGIALGPIELTSVASYAFFTSKAVTYFWMRRYLQNQDHGKKN